MERNMELDKIYTNERGLLFIKESLEKLIDYSDFEEIIDPCAGAGQFGKIIPLTHQYDISPDSSDVIEQDFLLLKLEKLEDKKRLIACSPPFGENFNKGTEFLLNCSEKSDTLASIVSSKINPIELIPEFKLVFTGKFEGKCFIKNDENIELNHLFCIWTKK